QSYIFLSHFTSLSLLLPRSPLFPYTTLFRSHGFRFYFTPLPGCFSPFPHGTGSLSVTREYLALGDGPPGFRRNFSCSAVLRIHSGGDFLSITGLLPSLADRSRSIHLRNLLVTPYGMSYYPSEYTHWFGLFPFRSPLLGKSHLLSLPLGTEMFQFPRSASCILCIQIHVLFHYEQWVPPFGNLRIAVYLQLPEAYRC